MSFARSAAFVGAFSLISQASAHGIVTGIVAGGQWHSGYRPSFQYQNPQPEVAGWYAPEDLDTGYVNDYSDPDIICHKGATPGVTYIPVAAGGTVELQWTDWPVSHHGPMMDYLANCGDDCTTVDKTKLLWNKIDEAGLNDGSTPPGDWASDDMIANNNSWVVTIPSFIAPGKYVLRHETIALHSAHKLGAEGAQNYPQCINLEITGSGSNPLSGGTLGTQLYKSDDPGIFINIYRTLESYIIPGPPVIDGAGSGSPPPPASTSPVASTTTSARFSNSTTPTSTPGRPPVRPTKPVEITATVTTDIAVVTTTQVEEKPTPVAPGNGNGGRPPRPPVEEEPEAPAPPVEEKPDAPAPPVEEKPTIPERPVETSPVSFTSTVTGRIGRPTKFTCYIDE